MLMKQAFYPPPSCTYHLSLLSPLITRRRDGFRSWSPPTATSTPSMLTHTMLRAMKEKTATTVNMTVGMSITTAEPMFVPKKEMVAIQPLSEEASCGAMM